jgi:hypothetical protein
VSLEQPCLGGSQALSASVPGHGDRSPDIFVSLLLQPFVHPWSQAHSLLGNTSIVSVSGLACMHTLT